MHARHIAASAQATSQQFGPLGSGQRSPPGPHASSHLSSPQVRTAGEAAQAAAADTGAPQGVSMQPALRQAHPRAQTRSPASPDDPPLRGSTSDHSAASSAWQAPPPGFPDGHHGRSGTLAGVRAPEGAALGPAASHSQAADAHGSMHAHGGTLPNGTSAAAVPRKLARGHRAASYGAASAHSHDGDPETGHGLHFRRSYEGVLPSNSTAALMELEAQWQAHEAAGDDAHAAHEADWEDRVWITEGAARASQHALGPVRLSAAMDHVPDGTAPASLALAADVASSSDSGGDTLEDKVPLWKVCAPASQPPPQRVCSLW